MLHLAVVWMDGMGAHCTPARRGRHADIGA